MSRTPAPFPRSSLVARTWSSLRSAAVERLGEDEVRWRALGALFTAGGLLAFAVVALPTDPATQTWPLVATAVIAVLSGFTMVLLASHLPAGDRWVSASLAFGTVLISLTVLFSQVPTSPFALLYVWVAVDGFLFLTQRAAFRHLLFVAAAYGVALVAVDTEDAGIGGRWVLTVGTVFVIGGLADVMRERSARLVARLAETASTDALTGLWNRRGFEELVEAEFAGAARSGRPVSVLVGDLDHFKAINDLYGHRGGDDALRELSALLLRARRRGDIAARIGGEEFAMILPDCDHHQAFVLAERLRRRVRDELGRDGRRLSISIGIASRPAHGLTPDAVVQHADQALYLAKHLGRDRSVTYSPEVATRRAGRADLQAAPEQLSAVLVLAETLDLRDSDTAAHSQTVANHAEAIAVRLGLPASRVARIRLAGLLHDVGKIGVPDAILQKPGPLSDAEWVEMRKHPELGARILAAASLDDISGWVLAHHERPDGGGYPAGAAADEIPLEARILAVADAFEAMTSTRVYRPGMPMGAAIAELRRCAGTQFEAVVVDTLIATLEAAVPTPTAATRPGRTAGAVPRDGSGAALAAACPASPD